MFHVVNRNVTGRISLQFTSQCQALGPCFWGLIFSVMFYPASSTIVNTTDPKHAFRTIPVLRRRHSDSTFLPSQVSHFANVRRHSDTRASRSQSALSRSGPRSIARTATAPRTLYVPKSSHSMDPQMASSKSAKKDNEQRPSRLLNLNNSPPGQKELYVYPVLIYGLPEPRR